MHKPVDVDVIEFSIGAMTSLGKSGKYSKIMSPDTLLVDAELLAVE